MATIMTEDKQFHIQVNSEQVGRYVILPGDPGRVEKIAQFLENPEFQSSNREYTIYTGTLLGERVTVCSTGIGGPSSAIAIEELIKCGCDTFIRVGTSGGMDLKVFGGDLIIASAAIRGDGTSREYMPLDYPAVADFDVTLALKNAAEKVTSDKDGDRYHIGVVQSKDSFYGEVEPDNMPVAHFLNERWEEYLRCGCLTSEMECATLYSVGLARRVRVGSILTALWNVERSKANLPDFITHDSTKAINCTIEAIKELIIKDKSKA